MKTDSGYPRDAEVTLFTLANPEHSFRFNTHWSAPPVSALAHSRGPRNRSQSPVSRNSNIERRMVLSVLRREKSKLTKEFGFTHTKPFPNLNRPDQQQHSHSLYHPTSLIHVEDRPIPHDIHYTTLFNPDLSIYNTTTPPRLCTEPLSLPTSTQPLLIPPQPGPTNQPHSAATLSYPHTSTQLTTLTPLVPPSHNLTSQLCFLFTFYHIREIVTFNFSPKNLTQVTSAMKPGQCMI